MEIMRRSGINTISTDFRCFHLLSCSEHFELKMNMCNASVGGLFGCLLLDTSRFSVNSFFSFSFVRWPLFGCTANIGSGCPIKRSRFWPKERQQINNNTNRNKYVSHTFIHLKCNLRSKMKENEKKFKNFGFRVKQQGRQRLNISKKKWFSTNWHRHSCSVAHYMCQLILRLIVGMRSAFQIELHHLCGNEKNDPTNSTMSMWLLCYLLVGKMVSIK